MNRPNLLEIRMPNANKKAIPISLVLGSGGARGLAHIGVIRWLEENGYAIQSIAGCSIGAMIGGVYAAGKLDELEQWMSAITRLDMVALMDLSFDGGGLMKGEKIIETLVSLVGDCAIEDMPIKFTAVAADIDQEKEVWINSGPLFDAVRASISVPFMFTPYRINGVDLVDGGVLNPVPIAPTFGDPTELTIAVNLGGLPTDAPETDTSAPAPVPEEPSILPSYLGETIAGFIEKLTADEPQNSTPSVFDVVNQSFDAMQSTIARQKLAAYPPDITLTIPRRQCQLLEFDRAKEMIALGYALAASSIPTNA